MSRPKKREIFWQCNFTKKTFQYIVTLYVRGQSQVVFNKIDRDNVFFVFTMNVTLFMLEGYTFSGENLIK